MKQTLKELSLALLCSLFTLPAFSQGTIDFQGLGSNGQGLALWNHKTNSQQQGYDLQDYLNGLPNGCISYAFYFMASADYNNFNNNTAVNTGATATGTITGFTAFQASLRQHNKSVNDLHFRFSAMDLGDKVRGENFEFTTPTKEERYYEGGQFELVMDNTVILSGTMPKMTAKINYNTLSECTDDELSGKSAYTSTITIAAGLPGALNAIARSFKRDATGRGKMIQFELLSLAPTSAGRVSFSTATAMGGFYDIQLGKMKVVKIRVPARPSLNWTWKGRLTYAYQKKLIPNFADMRIIIKTTKGKKTIVRPDAKGNFTTKLPSGKYNIVVMDKTSKLHSSTVSIKRNMTKNLTLGKSLPKKVLPKFQKKN